jgi:hypothetical protein
MAQFCFLSTNWEILLKSNFLSSQMGSHSFSPSSLSTAKWQNIAGSKRFFRPDQFILVATNSFWLRPFHFGRDQIIMVKSKSIWSDQNHFGPTKTVLVT